MFAEIRECLSLLFVRCTLPFMTNGQVLSLVEWVGRNTTECCVHGDARKVAFGTDMLDLIYCELHRRGLVDLDEAP